MTPAERIARDEWLADLDLDAPAPSDLTPAEKIARNEWIADMRATSAPCPRCDGETRVTGHALHYGDGVED